MKNLKLKVLSIIMTLVMVLSMGSIGTAAQVTHLGSSNGKNGNKKWSYIRINLTGIRGPGLDGTVAPAGDLSLHKGQEYTVDYTLSIKEWEFGDELSIRFHNLWLEVNGTRIDLPGRTLIKPGVTSLNDSFNFVADESKSLTVVGNGRRWVEKYNVHRDSWQLTYSLKNEELTSGADARWYFATHPDTATDAMNYDTGTSLFWPSANAGFPGKVRLKAGDVPTFTAIGDAGEYSTDYAKFEYLITNGGQGENAWVGYDAVKEHVKSVLADQTVSISTTSEGSYALKFNDEGVSVDIMRIKRPRSDDPYYHVDCWIKREKSEGLELNYYYDGEADASNPIKHTEAGKTDYVGSIRTITPDAVKDVNGIAYKLISVTERDTANTAADKLNVVLGKLKKIVDIKYERAVHQVSFNSDGGSDVPAQNVKDGEMAVKPADPTKDGYTFKGWFEDGAADEFNFSTPIKKNTTLTAKWEGNQNPGGGTGENPGGGSGDNPGGNPGDNPGGGSGDNPGGNPGDNPGGGTGDNPGGGSDVPGGGSTPTVDNPVWIDPLPTDDGDTEVIADDDTPLSSGIEDEEVIIPTDEGEVIADDTTPLAAEIELEEDEVPLADLPKTGAIFTMRTYAIAAALISGGVIVATVALRKKEEE